MSVEYGAPANLSGAYDPGTAAVDLLWDPSTDGVTQLFLTNGTYTTDYTASQVLVTLLGGGGGGAGGAAASGDWVPSAGGGAYIQAAYSISSLPSTVAVTIGAPGTGGTPTLNSGSITVGANGGNTVCAGLLQAGGGGGAGSLLVGGTGGAPTVISSTGLIGSATTESGGAGGDVDNTGVRNINGRSTTYAGPGGGSSGRSSGNGSAGPTGGAGGTCTNGGTGGTPGAGGVSSGSSGSSGASVPSGVIVGGGGGGGAGGEADIGGSGHGAAGAAGGSYGAGASSGASCATRGGTPTLGGQGGNGGSGVLETVTSWAHSHDPQYLVYRNGVLIGVTAIGVTAFSDPSFVSGTNTYQVVASYDGVTPMSPDSNSFVYNAANSVVNSSGRFVPPAVYKASVLTNLAGLRPRIWRPGSNNTIKAK
jgi:hypothetical protein